jgi:formylglycine-generating enzyme required for sulfatase activity
MGSAGAYIQPGLVDTVGALVFLSYAPEDSAHRDMLEKHLAPLVRARVLRLWHDGKVRPGENRSEAVEAQIEAAAVVLLLVSADYLASDRCHSEMTRALARAQAGKGRVVPILLRPCLANRDALLDLALLPTDGKAVTTWTSSDDAWANVAAGIDKAVDRHPPSVRGALASEPGMLAELPEPVTQAGQASKARMSGRMRRPLDDDTILCLAKLEDARVRKHRLEDAGAGTRDVDAEMLTLKRQLREGGQVRQGDLLGGRYSLLQHIGRGGFATVWEAEDRREHRRVALKVLHTNLADDPDRTDRFLRGARVMAGLTHPAVVRIIDAHVEDGGYCCFAMELVPGGDLQRAVVEGRFPPERVVPMIVRIGDALVAAHARGYIHRDIKPANILLDASGAPKLTDFDLVGDEDTSGGTHTGAMGTFVYAAPEVLSRPQDADVRADVFGLGMTALFCLHGRRLPDTVFRNPERVIAQIRDKAVGAVLRKAIEWEPRDRFPSMKAFCDALRETGPAKGSAPDQRRLAFGAVAAVLLSGGALLLRNAGWLGAGLVYPEPAPTATGVPPRGGLSSVPPGSSIPSTPSTVLPRASSPPLLPSCPDGMVPIPGGTFTMGSPKNNRDQDYDERGHDVTLSPFCIDLTEVTVKAYRDCAARVQNGVKCPAVPVTVKGTVYGDVRVNNAWCNGGARDREDHPINCVDWMMAERYCRWAGKRLPSEAQWEYAARGTSGRKYVWGDDDLAARRLNGCGPECSDMLAKEAHFEQGTLHDEADPWPWTAPVGKVEGDRSAFEVRDMAGNVIEWVADWYVLYDILIKKDPVQKDPLQNTKPTVEPKRVQRGAGWMTYLPARARAPYRFYEPDDTRSANVGFRCARDPLP